MRRSAVHITLLISILVTAGCVTRSDRVIEIDGDRRAYYLHVPESHDTSRPVPLVLVLHPFGSTGYGMAKMTGFNELADAENFIAVYPDGELHRWRAGEETWEDVNFLLELIKMLESTYSIDPHRIYVTGASNGAHMTYRMLCDAGSRFAAAATVMGSGMTRRLHDECADPAPVPMMMIHGTEDWILPWRGRKWTDRLSLLSMEETVQLWLERNQCGADGITAQVPDKSVKDDTTTTRTTYDGCTTGAPLVVYRVEGGGHTWPGGHDNYPEFVVGAKSRDFDASRAIWEFFDQFPREHTHEP